MSDTREVELKPGQCALLVIDLQNYCAVPGRGYHSNVDPNNMTISQRYVFDRIDNTLVPAVQKLLSAFRKTKSEIIYTYIENLTSDGRDRSLDYKISQLSVPKGSPDAHIITPLAPTGDEIMIPKTSCSVFCSTNIEYVLRNLGVSQLVVVGMITNQCVESAVRDAADKGFLVTLVEDACAANSPEDQQGALKNMAGFSRICTADKVVAEVLTFP